jgi:hypothetical protein
LLYPVNFGGGGAGAAHVRKCRTRVVVPALLVVVTVMVCRPACRLESAKRTRSDPLRLWAIRCPSSLTVVLLVRRKLVTRTRSDALEARMHAVAETPETAISALVWNVRSTPMLVPDALVATSR